MTRRFIFGLAAAGLVAAAVVGFLVVPRSPITQANVGRARGLKLAEVEQRLGGPGLLLHGDIAWEVQEFTQALGADPANPADVATVQRWDDGRGAALVFFDADDRALGALFDDRRPPGFFAQLRRLLGLEAR